MGSLIRTQIIANSFFTESCRNVNLFLFQCCCLKYFIPLDNNSRQNPFTDKWQEPYSNRLAQKINKQTNKQERTGKLSAAGLAALVSSSSWFCSPLCRRPYPTGSSLSWQDGGQYFTSEVTTHVLSLTLTGAFRPRSLLNTHYEEQERICCLAKARGICPFVEHKMHPIPCLWRESGRGAFSKEKLGTASK